MYRKVVTVILVFIISFDLVAEDHLAYFDFINGTKLCVATQERGQELVSTYDPYIEKLSRFDLEARINTMATPDPKNYLDFSRKQIREWRKDEIRKLDKIIQTVKGKIIAQGINLVLPDTIELVKSTCMEEGGAIGYTRLNFIVLAENFLYEDVISHELFHIYSRYNPRKRKELYAVLGFHNCNNIEYPELIQERKMTNPDAPDSDYYIRIVFHEDSLDVLLTTYATSEYNGGSFFSYLTKRLMVLSGEDDVKEPLIRDGRPVMLRFNTVKGFYDQIGKNTEYNIHPEEICADHFVQLLTRKKSGRDQVLIDRMGEVMKE